jgi:hypothetical protein
MREIDGRGELQLEDRQRDGPPIATFSFRGNDEYSRNARSGGARASPLSY